MDLTVTYAAQWFFTWSHCPYQITTEAADVEGQVFCFCVKLKFLLISKVRTWPIINLNILNLIEKCTIQVIKDICCCNDVSSALTKGCSPVCVKKNKHVDVKLWLFQSQVLNGFRTQLALDISDYLGTRSLWRSSIVEFWAALVNNIWYASRLIILF